MLLVTMLTSLTDKIKAAKGPFKWILSAAIFLLSVVATLIISHNMDKAAKDKADAMAKSKDLKDYQERAKLDQQQDEADALQAHADELKRQADALHDSADARLSELERHKEAVEKARNWEDLHDA